MAKAHTVSLTEIQQDLIIIIRLLIKAFFKIENCIELRQNTALMQNKIVEVIQILLKLQRIISEKVTNSSLSYHMVNDLENNFRLHLFADIEENSCRTQFKITQVNKTISNITILLDRSAINCKFCPELGIRPYVSMIANAMCELFELQRQYIYTIQSELIPAYLILTSKIK